MCWGLGCRACVDDPFDRALNCDVLAGTRSEWHTPTVFEVSRRQFASIYALVAQPRLDGSRPQVIAEEILPHIILVLFIALFVQLWYYSGDDDEDEDEDESDESDKDESVDEHERPGTATDKDRCVFPRDAAAVIVHH